MAKAVIIENQSVLDATVQHLGNLEAAFDFCFKNGKNLTEDLFSNEVVEIPESLDQKADVSNYFAEKSIELATGFPLIEEIEIGIGEMIIQQTFIVT